MQKVKLLLVEDDEEDFELFQDTLDEISSYNFEVTWANTFKQGIAKIESEEFDLFVIDYILGAYSGLDLCQEIMLLSKPTPIILLTGKGDQAIDEKASDMGVSNFLIKREINSVNLERSIRYSLKQAEILAALKVSESKYRAVLEQSKDILFIANTNCKILSVSDSLESITGYKPEELGENGLLTLVSDEKLRTKFKETILAQKSILSEKITITCKNGDIKTVILTCNYQDTYNNQNFLHGVIIDKTDEIKAQRNKLVYEKLESTSRFMRTLAHEVRNPLSNISLAIEGMEAEEEEVSPYLSIIKRNSGRIDSIITKVLNSAQIEEKAFEPLNIIEIIQKTIETVEDKAKLKGIELMVKLPAEPLILPLNEEQISLAISNLLVNAVEAIDDNKDGIIQVYLDGTELIISDNGPGISKEDQSKIFEPYFTKKTNGIGLGLASSLSILKAHQIEIDLVSDLNSGATFKLKLPLNEA